MDDRKQLNERSRVTFAELLDAIGTATGFVPKQTRTGDYMARCPAHSDGSPSLSIREAPDGKYLLCCHANCTTKQILDAIGDNIEIELWDLMGERTVGRNGQHQNGRTAAKIIDTYDYRNTDGSLRYQVVRREGKIFQQRQPDGRGGWTWNLKGVEPTLYRLAELLAAPVDQWCFYPEGEKDVNKLVRHGLTATCNSGGAGRWRPEFAEYLRDRKVCVLADDDAPGHKHAEQVAQALHGVAAVVRIVTCPGGGKDVSDFLDGLPETTDPAAAVIALAEQAADWTPQERTSLKYVPATPTVGTSGEEPAAILRDGHITEVVLAHRLAEQAAGHYLFNRATGWLRWSGKRYEPDEANTMTARAIEVVRGEYAGLAQIPDTALRDRAYADLKRMESASRLDGIVRIASTDDRVYVRVEELDSDPFLLNVQNGTLNLLTGELRGHRQDDRLTHICFGEFDPDHQAPRWTRFIEQVQPDPTNRAFVQRLFGMTLSGATGEQRLPFHVGPGANGKSCGFSAIAHALGSYARAVPADTLTERREGGARPDLVRLRGVRLVTCMEMNEGVPLNEGFVKALVGGDTIPVRDLYRSMFDLAPEFIVACATNHKPRVRTGGHALWRRLIVVPWLVTIPDDQQDKALSRKLRAEATGILTWLWQGFQDWRQNGLGISDAARRATADYEAAEDVLARFLADAVVITAGAETDGATLYDTYVSWCKGQGETEVSASKFSRRLRDRGMTFKTGGGRRKLWQDVELTRE